MRARGLAVYSVAACLLRGADAAAIIGIVLAARPAGAGDATGLLAACITLPHLAGPVAAQLLDRTRAKRVVLAAAGLLYAVALTVAVLLLDVSLIAAAGGLLVAGFAGPLLTGGLSSQLAALVGDSTGGGERARRRAQGLDAFTYGVSATAGPAVVAVIASSGTPTTAVLTAAGAAAAGAVAVLFLPGARSGAGSREQHAADRTAVGTLPAALTMLVRLPGLRRTMVATAVTAIPLGAVPLLAVATVDSLGAPAASSAVLTAAYGAGNLVVSAVLVVLPLRGGADRLVRAGVVTVAVAFAVCAPVLALPMSAAAFALLGIATGVLFTASLAARATFSPSGAEAQVFVSMAGIKVACSSIGTGVAGTLLPLGGPVLAGGATVIAVVTLAWLVVDGRVQPGAAD